MNAEILFEFVINARMGSLYALISLGLVFVLVSAN